MESADPVYAAILQERSAVNSTDSAIARNVLGQPLVPCSFDPLTGFLRDGCCRTDAQDLGTHIVCAVVTKAFLEFSFGRGNDLITPRPEWRFAGLRPGDQWCLCANRWQEALQAGVAPPIVLESTHAKMLEFVSLEQLQQYAHSPEDFV
jgi:uncharacterized protein